MATAFEIALYAKRKGMRPQDRARTLHPKVPAQPYPLAIENSYGKWIQSLLRPLIARVEQWFEQNGEAMLRGDSSTPTRKDAQPGAGFTSMIKNARSWVAMLFPALDSKKEGVAQEAYTSIWLGVGITAEAVKKVAERAWDKQSKSILGFPFPLGAVWWPEMKRLWQERNYELIVTVAQQYIGKVNDLAENAIRNGWTHKQLTDDIKAAGLSTGWPARRIARDQIGKLNGSITGAQQTEAGVDLYTWYNMSDERVRGNPAGRFPNADPSHWIMQGLICKWADADVYSSDGGKTWKNRTGKMEHQHPGQAILCRCTAIPFFDEMINRIDQQIDDQEKRAA